MSSAPEPLARDLIPLTAAFPQPDRAAWLAPVALAAGYLGPIAADWLGAAAKGAPAAQLHFHLDPLTTLAATGASPGPIEAHLISAATVGARLAQTYPRSTLFLASGRAAHE